MKIKIDEQGRAEGFGGFHSFGLGDAGATIEWAGERWRVLAVGSTIHTQSNGGPNFVFAEVCQLVQS